MAPIGKFGGKNLPKIFQAAQDFMRSLLCLVTYISEKIFSWISKFYSCLRQALVFVR
jgi:hypothetical protein